MPPSADSSQSCPSPAVHWAVGEIKTDLICMFVSDVSVKVSVKILILITLLTS